MSNRFHCQNDEDIQIMYFPDSSFMNLSLFPHYLKNLKPLCFLGFSHTFEVFLTIRATIQAMIAGGAPPDVMMISSGSLANFADQFIFPRNQTLGTSQTIGYSF